MGRQESIEYYNKALRQGRKYYKDRTARGQSPYLQVLDKLLDDTMVASRVDLGVIDIPIDKIVGTKTEGRTTAFAGNFMPLLEVDTEFSLKWMALCEAHLGDEGIRDPIRCFEYLGQFYVQEGNKRVSVLKSFGAPTIAAYVTREVPVWSDSPEIQAYYDFLDAFRLTGLYRVAFSHSGSFAKLQAALGYDPDHKWTEEERKRFVAGYTWFQDAFRKLGGEELPITVADAMLVWLKYYPFSALTGYSAAELLKSLEAVWADIKVLDHPDPISVSTETHEGPEKPQPSGFLNRIFRSSPPSHLNLAFINEYAPEKSDWIRAHDLGRQYLEAVMGDKITVQTFNEVGAEGGDAAMETAIQNGAQVIFATTPSMIGPCRRTAARHPEVRIMNCSISMPYTGVRTYYNRIYEGKFITGAIAGALCKSGRLGYVASSPIFGVPASINAFALGAQMTNPDIQIRVRWYCVEEDAMGTLAREGAELVSNRDIPAPDRSGEPWGLCRVGKDGKFTPLASPYWHWGNFYVKLVRSIFSGGWDALNSPDGRAVNCWWGLRSRTTGVLLSEKLPAGVCQLAEFLRQGIASRTIDPFQRLIRSQDGTVRNDGHHWFSPEEILQMDWLCDCVEGSIPAYEELLPAARTIVRLQGVYRDQLTPEKEDTIL